MHPGLSSSVAPPRFLWSFPKNWTQRIPSPLSSEGIYNDKLDKLDRQPCHIPTLMKCYVCPSDTTHMHTGSEKPGLIVDTPFLVSNSCSAPQITPETDHFVLDPWQELNFVDQCYERGRRPSEFSLNTYVNFLSLSDRTDRPDRDAFRCLISFESSVLYLLS